MQKTNPKPVTNLYEPATPDPRYICKNCGMIIETGHKHTLPECKEYIHPTDAPKNPDHRAILKISEFPTITDPKVRLPRYYDSSEDAKNSLKVATTQEKN